MNLGSLKNDLLLPPNFKANNPDDDDLEDELMLLGTTPNVNSGVAGELAAAATSAVRSGAVVRANSAAFARENGHNELLARCIDEEDELMGMSPDMPSMMRSPAAGFTDYMKRGPATYEAPGQSSLAAAAAAPNEQVSTMAHHPS